MSNFPAELFFSPFIDPVTLVEWSRSDCEDEKKTWKKRLTLCGKQNWYDAMKIISKLSTVCFEKENNPLVFIFDCQLFHCIHSAVIYTKISIHNASLDYGGRRQLELRCINTIRQRNEDQEW